MVLSYKRCLTNYRKLRTVWWPKKKVDQTGKSSSNERIAMMTKKGSLFVVCCVLISSNAYAEQAKDQTSKTSAAVKKVEKSAQDTNISDVLDKLADDKSLKIAVVSSFECMGNCEVGKDARQELEKQQAVLVKEYQDKEKDLADALNKFKEKSAMMSEDARKTEEKRILKMKTELEELGQEAREKIQTAMTRKTETLAQNFEDVVKSYGEKEAYDFIIDQNSGRVVYAAPDKDVTKNIIDLMDKTKSGKKKA